jgi:hypothetical protein
MSLSLSMLLAAAVSFHFLQMVMMMLMPLASLSAVCLFSAPCCRCGVMSAVGPCFCTAAMNESRACV